MERVALGVLLKILSNVRTHCFKILAAAAKGDGLGAGRIKPQLHGALNRERKNSTGLAAAKQMDKYVRQ
jgi:hypothetical protein